MKLLPTIVTVSSIACGLTQALSLVPSTTPSSDLVCPAECGLPERELLKLMNEENPQFLKDLADKYPILPSGSPTDEVLKGISDHSGSGMIHLII